MKELITALKSPTAYPHPVQRITAISTHISDILLTGNFAYKICKPVNLGFADFSTVEKRKEQCLKEFKVNTMLSPDLYYGVVPITKERTGAVVMKILLRRKTEFRTSFPRKIFHSSKIK